MNKQHIILREGDRATLEQLLSHGTLSARKFKRATALLELDRGKTLVEVAATLQVNYTTVASWRDGYTATGLACLDDAPRSGRPPSIDGLQNAKITALACSDAPEGYARWSLRLLADKAVEAGICDQISHTAVADILKKTRPAKLA
jgi:putative transposase